MNYTLAVFKSRSSTLFFANLLRQSGIPSAVINTPYSIGKACGISVKFLSDFSLQAQRLLTKQNLMTSFSGFYTQSMGRWIAV